MNFWENSNYAHLYSAMKKAREEIGSSILNNKLILFEAIPLNFSLDKAPDHFHVKNSNVTEDLHRKGPNQGDQKANRCQIGRTNKWKIMANKVLDPNYSQLKDLIRALDKIEELNEHDEQV